MSTAAIDAAERVVRQAPGLTPRTDRMIRRISTVTVIVLALAAAILSYSGLAELAVQADINPSLAFLFPVVVDGLTLVGGLQVLYSVLLGVRSWYGWTLTLLGVTASVWGNVAASPSDLTSQIVHSAPPITLALALEALLRVYRHRATRLAEEAQADTAAAEHTERVVQAAVEQAVAEAVAEAEERAQVEREQLLAEQAQRDAAQDAERQAEREAQQREAERQAAQREIEQARADAEAAREQAAQAQAERQAAAAEAQRLAAEREQAERLAAERAAQAERAEAERRAAAAEAERLEAERAQAARLAAEAEAEAERQAAARLAKARAEADRITAERAARTAQPQPVVEVDREPSSPPSAQAEKADPAPAAKAYAGAIDPFAVPNISKAPASSGNGTASNGTASNGAGSDSDTDESGLTARERIAALLAEEPDLKGAEVARRLGLDKSYTYKIVKDLRPLANA